MRCRNCSSLVADTDRECPFCHTPLIQRNTAAAAVAARRDGLLVQRARQSPAFKWCCGGLILLGGCFAMLIGLAIALEAQQGSERGAKIITEAELCKVDDASTLLGTWIAYDSPKTIHTGAQLEYISGRKKDKIHSRFSLLRVGHRWMIAELAPNYSGQRYVGEIKELSHSPLGEKVLQEIRRRQPAETQSLLPYYLYGVKTFERGTRSQYVTAGGVGLFGLLFAAFAVKMLRAKPNEVLGSP